MSAPEQIRYSGSDDPDAPEDEIPFSVKVEREVYRMLVTDPDLEVIGEAISVDAWLQADYKANYDDYLIKMGKLIHEKDDMVIGRLVREKAEKHLEWTARENV